MDGDVFHDRFGGLAGGLERDELDALLERLDPLDVAAGEVLITEGTATAALYLVWDGSLAVSVRAGETDVELGTVEAGGYLGEVSLLDPGPASASVRSELGATVLALEHQSLASFEAEHPAAAAALGHELARILIQRLRYSAHRLAGLEIADTPTVGVTNLAAPDATAALAALPGVGTLPADEQASLGALMEPREFHAGDVIGRVGTRPDGVHLLLSGAVTRRLDDDSGTSPLVRLLPGTLVGGEALAQTVLATDLIAEPATTAVLPRTALLRLAADAPRQAWALERAATVQLAQQLRALTALLPPVQPTAPVRQTDVAVIGAGMNGLAYARFLKDARPQASVTVLDRAPHPGYKIGESTLGTTTRCMQRLGLDMPVMRRLFSIKAGIRFWWTDEGDTQLHRHIDAVDVEETFQVERRVQETILIEATRRAGIDVRTNTRVNLTESDLGTDTVRLRCEPGDEAHYDLSADVVCDASGPASLLPRRFGSYRRDPQRLATFNSNAYYAYFRQRDEVPVPLWDQPATRHVCFPQGWCWFISITSWEGTPQENLEAMTRFLLDHPRGPDESYPSRRELEERFGCTSEPILSVGFTVREDSDTALGESVEQRFNHYADRYPAIRGILDHYDLIEQPYAKRQPYSAFLRLAHDARTVAGQRWCAVGDAAMFSNPLFSPGLNFGTGTAFEAAQDTARALGARDLSPSSFRAYQHYADRTYEILMAFNDMLYRSFAHPDTFERALIMFFFHSAADVFDRDVYSETDPYVWDLLNPEFSRRVDEIRQILRTAEQRGTDLAEVVDDVRSITDGYIATLTDGPALQAMDVRTALRDFDRDGHRAEERHTLPGNFSAGRCPVCREWVDRSLAQCPVCATVNDAVGATA